MIPKVVIRSYLKAERDDHRWLKELSDQELDDALDAVRPRPKLYDKIRLNQKVGVLLGIAYPKFAFFYDMGLGKTLLSLELLRYWWQVGKMRRALIFVTSDKAFPTWRKQIAGYKINMPYVMLEGPSQQKWADLERFGDGLIFATYPGVVKMCSVRVRHKGKNVEVLDKDRMDALIAGVSALVLDESTKAGGSSLTHDLCRYIARRTKIHYGLAGRPFGRDPTLLWAQQRIIDGGESLGETVGLFREAFFSSGRNWFAKNKHAQTYKFDKRHLNKLMQMSRHRSLAYASEECIDLPPHIPIIEEVVLPEEASIYYAKLIKQIIAARGNLVEMNNAVMRMRQLSSGFLGFRNQDDGQRAQVAFDENPKLERLLELLEALPEGRKAVVFYEFTWSARRIVEELKKQKRDLIWLWSGTKNSQEDLMRFENNPSCDIAILQNKVGAYSLDGLQVANYSLFYESPISVIDREQAERRTLRQGQVRKVFQYDLVVRGTFDQRILEFHAEGADLLKALRANPKQILKGLNVHAPT